jgi:hypothetical protein
MTTIATLMMEVKPGTGASPDGVIPAGPTDDGPHGNCRLTLTIDETDYAIRPLAGEGLPGCWAIRKPGGKVYRVGRDDAGRRACTCPDATYRRHECKHVRALVACGLIS